MKYEVTQPQTLNGIYYGIGDTVTDDINIPNVEVLIQNAVLIPVKEPDIISAPAEEVKMPVDEEPIQETPTAPVATK